MKKSDAPSLKAMAHRVIALIKRLRASDPGAAIVEEAVMWRIRHIHTSLFHKP